MFIAFFTKWVAGRLIIWSQQGALKQVSSRNPENETRGWGKEAGERADLLNQSCKNFKIFLYKKPEADFQVMEQHYVYRAMKHVTSIQLLLPALVLC